MLKWGGGREARDGSEGQREDGVIGEGKRSLPEISPGGYLDYLGKRLFWYAPHSIV